MRNQNLRLLFGQSVANTGHLKVLKSSKLIIASNQYSFIKYTLAACSNRILGASLIVVVDFNEQLDWLQLADCPRIIINSEWRHQFIHSECNAETKKSNEPMLPVL